MKLLTFLHSLICGMLCSLQVLTMCWSYGFGAFNTLTFIFTGLQVGLTLVEANTVVFAEVSWQPGTLAQAEARAHRVGQTQPVVVSFVVEVSCSLVHGPPLSVVRAFGHMAVSWT